MERTKILLVLEGGYPWHRGGVSEWTYQLLRNSLDSDFAILQISSDSISKQRVSEALYEITENVTSFTRIPPPEIKKDWKEEVNHWLTDISKNLESVLHSCDIIHITNTGFAGWLGMKMASIWDKPLLLTEHALYWKEVQMGTVSLESGTKIPDSEGVHSLYINMLGEMARQIYSAADHTISVSKSNIPLQEMFGAKDVAYIPNGIGEEWLLKDEIKRGSDLTIGWVGRCAHMKNPLKFFELIDAFEERGEVNASFLMLSCDANEPALEQRLRAKCENYPQLKLIWNQSAKEFIDQMDALCVTSHNESQPLVLFEALARKVLPVGWQTGDANSRYGIFVPPDKPANYLLNHIIAKWRSPEEWKQLVNQKHKVVAQNHLWETIFERYHQLIKKIQKRKIYAQ